MPVHVSSGQTSVGSCIKSSDYYGDSRVSGCMRLHSIMSWVCKLTVLPCTLLDVQCKLTDSGETVGSELVFCRKFIHINKHQSIERLSCLLLRNGNIPADSIYFLINNNVYEMLSFVQQLYMLNGISNASSNANCNNVALAYFTF